MESSMLHRLQVRLRLTWIWSGPVYKFCEIMGCWPKLTYFGIKMFMGWTIISCYGGWQRGDNQIIDEAFWFSVRSKYVCCMAPQTYLSANTPKGTGRNTNDTTNSNWWWWGTILGWVRRDGMARMRIIGVVPTIFIVRCISWDLLVYYYMRVIYLPSCFRNNVTINSEMLASCFWDHT